MIVGFTFWQKTCLFVLIARLTLDKSITQPLCNALNVIRKISDETKEFAQTDRRKRIARYIASKDDTIGIIYGV